jgi:hypothetical protein
MKSKEERKYKYIFVNNTEDAKLTFISTTVQEATIKLSKMVNSVADWYMKRVKL